jgi:aryl-alcohol dehydrogenase-like predicted oxidoreductase
MNLRTASRGATLGLDPRRTSKAQRIGRRNGWEAVIPTLLVISSGKVAITWTISEGVFPVTGLRTRAQLHDNLAAATLELCGQVRRMNEASGFLRG